MTGWCLTGSHTACPGTILLSMTAQTVTCPCQCHGAPAVPLQTPPESAQEPEDEEAPSVTLLSEEEFKEMIGQNV